MFIPDMYIENTDSVSDLNDLIFRQILMNQYYRQCYTKHKE